MNTEERSEKGDQEEGRGGQKGGHRTGSALEGHLKATVLIKDMTVDKE